MSLLAVASVEDDDAEFTRAVALSMALSKETERRKREREDEEEEQVRKAIQLSEEEHRRRSVSDDHDDEEDEEESRPLTTGEFHDCWQRVEKNMGLTTREIEDGRLVKEANHKISSENQSKAQYGRLMFAAAEKVFQVTRLRTSDKFVDIGHGIGNVAAQAAFTIGCESAGIELVQDRHLVSQQFYQGLQHAVSEQLPIPLIGDCNLVQGDLVDKMDWLASFDVAFVNNFNDVFGARATNKTRKTLDSAVAMILVKMKPGSRILTLGALGDLAGLARSDINHPSRNDASFFDRETILLKPSRPIGWVPGHDDQANNDPLSEKVVSWSSEDIPAYLYTRLPGPASDYPAFLCTNPNCGCFPTAAIADDGISLNTQCVYCDIKQRPKRRG